MDFPELNLRGILYCGQCYLEDEVAATNSYRLIHKSSGTYYYLDQRHTPHEVQRQTLPSWLVHRLVFRALTHSLAHREEFLSRHRGGVPYRIAYPDQTKLKQLWTEREMAVGQLNVPKLNSLNKEIDQELQRLQLSYERGVRLCEFDPSFLENTQFVPEQWEDFDELVKKVIPQIYVYPDYITIHTTYAMAYDFDIPAKPDKTNDTDQYRMETFDVANMFIGAYLKEKYKKTNTSL